MPDRPSHHTYTLAETLAKGVLLGALCGVFGCLPASGTYKGGGPGRDIDLAKGEGRPSGAEQDADKEEELARDKEEALEEQELRLKIELQVFGLSKKQQNALEKELKGMDDVIELSARRTADITYFNFQFTGDLDDLRDALDDAEASSLRAVEINALMVYEKRPDG